MIVDYALNLKKYRTENKLSQKEMAARLGLKNQQAYAYYENLGEKLDTATARNFGDKLGVDIINYGVNNHVTGPEAPETFAMAMGPEELYRMIVEIRAEVYAHSSAIAEVLAKLTDQKSTVILSEFQRVYNAKLRELQNALPAKK